MIKQFGFVPPTPKPEDHILGGFTKMPKVVENITGDWSTYYPDFESQLRPNFDSNGCTVYAIHNAIESALRGVYGLTFNGSERFIYNIVGVTPPGADPVKVAQAFRDNGIIKEGLLPVTDTLEEFMRPRPMTVELLKEGKKFAWEIRYEQLWEYGANLTPKEKRVIIKECLRYSSPIAGSVTAWMKKGFVYVDNGQPNTHLTMIGRDTSNGLEVFDSYEDDGSPIKILAPEHNIQFAMRIMLVPKAVEEQISRIQKLLNAIKEALLSIVTATPTVETEIVPVATPTPTITPSVEPKIEVTEKLPTISEFCLAIQKQEGYYKGSRSYTNRNPGNIKYVGQKMASGKDDKGFCIFPTYEIGFNELIKLVTRVVKEQSLVYPKNATIKTFCEVYAPSNDNNRPDLYAQALAKAIGKSIDYELKKLV